jgi:hypothetical protein
LSSPANSPYPNDPLKGLTRYQMNKFGGKESQYEYWKLQFQASYGARSTSAKEKTLFLLSVLEGEPSILCARFVRHNIDDMTYETLWEVLVSLTLVTFFFETSKLWANILTLS